MKRLSYFLLTIFLLISLAITAQPQKKYIKHTVLAGENVTQIAKKYKVTPYDIYKLNPEAKNGINENEILVIESNEPMGTIISDIKNNNNSYIVVSKDTKYSLSKKFNITIEELENWNPFIVRDGLQEGQVLILKNTTATNKNDNKNEPKKNNQDTYIIQAKDTKYSVSKQFGLTIEELENLNPQIKDGFPEGIEISVAQNNNNKNNSKENTTKPLIKYTILDQETLYGVAQKFNVSQMEILKLNPQLSEGFKEGLVINIPNKNKGVAENYSDKSKLIAAINTKQEKNLVLFLPFNLPKIEADSIKTKLEYLKDDAFLNMTLDFYAGALMAIDSVKKMGYPIKVKIFDTESYGSKNAIPSIISKTDFSKVEAIIGPFYDNQVEQTAQILEKYNIPIISPLSTKNGKPVEHVYYAMPSETLQRLAMFTHFKKNNGNVLAIFSKKKVKNKESLLAQFPDLTIVPLTENGAVTAENITPLLDSNKKNYIILDSENRSMVLNTTALLQKLQTKFNIQLVVFELNDVLDFEEIPMKRLTNLKLLFPSVTKSTTNGFYKSFQEKFKKINNINPSQYATRGFDVTLDTILRMYQENGFENAAIDSYSEQLESKFNYQKIENGNYNTSLYILEYSDDLTIEEAK